MTRNELINFGKKVWDSLKPCSEIELNTNVVAAFNRDDRYPVPAIYDALSALAKAGFPAVRQGKPVERKIFGKMTLVRPWLWQRPADDTIFTYWADNLPTEQPPTRPASPAIKELTAEIESLKARVEALESLNGKEVS